MSEPTKDHFLSEDDLNLEELSWDELILAWNAWLKAASATDEEDKYIYSHGVFLEAPRPK